MLPSSLDYIFKKNFSLFYILKHQNFLGYLFGYKIFVLQSHPPLYKNAKILRFMFFLGGGATLVWVKVFFLILGAILCVYERIRFCGVLFLSRTFSTPIHPNRAEKKLEHRFSDVFSVVWVVFGCECEKNSKIKK